MDADGNMFVAFSEHHRRMALRSGEKCSRTFITFTDERHIKLYFTTRKSKPPLKQYCPITRLPAKYLDPITQTPYANAQAFRVIRDAYQQQVLQGQDGSKRGSELSKQKQRLAAVAERTTGYI